MKTLSVYVPTLLHASMLPRFPTILFIHWLPDSIKNWDSSICTYSPTGSIPMSLPYSPGNLGSRAPRKYAQKAKGKVFTHPFHRTLTCRIAKES